MKWDLHKSIISKQHAIYKHISHVEHPDLIVPSCTKS